MKRGFKTLVLTGVVLAAGNLFAQQPQGQAPKSGMLTQEDLAFCLILDNLGEVQISRIALERAENEQVRQFAENMVREHLNLIQKIRQAGFGQQLPPQVQQQLQSLMQNRERRPGGPRSEQNPPPAVERQPGRMGQAGQGHEVSFRQLREEMAKNLVNRIRQGLEEKRGAQFDSAFMYCQIGMHEHMLASLETMKQHASPELQAIINAAIPATQQHLQQAEATLQVIGVGQPQREQRQGQPQPRR